MSPIRSFEHITGAKRYSSFDHENEFSFIYVKRGRAVLTVGEKEWHITRPSVIFISNLERYSLISESDSFERYFITMDPDLAERELASRELISPFVCRPEGFSNLIDVTEITQSLDMLYSLFESEFSAGSINESAISVLRVILLALYRFRQSAFPYVQSEHSQIAFRVIELLQKDISEDISLEEISHSLEISTFYLSHIFKEITGYSIKNFKLLLRLSKARELLASSDVGVADICREIGFPDMSNFARRFKTEYGVTPTEYRGMAIKAPQAQSEKKKRMGVELL